MATIFGEIVGDLAAVSASPVSRRGKVELSRVGTGSAYSPPRTTVALKYAAAGTEIYRYAGRVHRVSAGSFLLVPEGNEGEAGIDVRGGVALGMCVFLPQNGSLTPVGNRVEAPMIFPAEVSALGRLLASAHRSMRESPASAPLVADQLLRTVEAQLEPLIVEAVQQLNEILVAKVSTRYDTLRRLNAARTYLHSVLERPVELAELAAHVGASRFQLARDFAACFGMPPGAYHRRLRLDRARVLIGGGELSCTEAAVRFGFSDLAHFSRAYRRAFGRPPSAERS